MDEYEVKSYRVGEVFTPSTPVDKKELFSGRRDQIDKVIDAIVMAGQHVALYGERGVGKTSLASVIHDFLPQGSGLINVKINCDADTDFKGLFKNILAEIKLVTKTPGLGFNADVETRVESLAQHIDRDEINPNSLRFTFRQLPIKTIIIIDEFDRITDEDTKRLLADTIKNFSDYKVDTTFVLVGIADSVDDLVAEHQSIERALVQVSMPRMNTKELGEIVQKGLRALNMTIDPTAKKRLLRLSQGLPHYTHLLAFNSTREALKNKRLTVEQEDVKKAIDRSVEKGQQTIGDSYFKAVNSPRGNMYSQVLLACALAQCDDMGYFAATNVKLELEKIMGKTYEVSAFAQHLKQFCSNERGPVLKKVGYPRRYKYRFVNPLLGPFIIMNGLAKGLISNKDIES